MIMDINWIFFTSKYRKYAFHFGISKIGERMALAIVGCVKMKYLLDHQMQSWRDLPSLYVRTHPTNVINMDSIVSSILWDHKAFYGGFKLEDWVKKVTHDMPIDLVWVYLISIVFMNLMTTIKFMQTNQHEVQLLNKHL
jgi:Na+/glutamate symporter